MLTIDLADAGLTARPAMRHHHYAAFGLIIRSDFRLAELEAAPAGPFDLAINRTTVEHPSAVGVVGSATAFGPTEQLLVWESVGAFLVRGTDVIDVEPRDGVDDSLVALPLLGPVMALLLHLRGGLVLHASTVAIGEAGIVLLGDKGAGKSTTAATLAAAGHRLVSDDVSAIVFADGELSIPPAIDQLKLWDDAAAALSLDPAGARTLHPAIPKRTHRAAGGFRRTAVTPQAILVLERGAVAGLAQSSAPDALKALIRFSYVVRFDRSALPQASAARHLAQCAEVAARTFVGRLIVPTGVDRLAAIPELLERRFGPAAGTNS